MYAKRPNGPLIEHNPDAHETSLDVEYLQKRLDYMSNVVYPVIYQKGSSTKENDNTYFLNNKYVLKNKEPFPKGSYVMVLDTIRSAKHLPRYTGPYKVIRKNQGGAYILEDHDGSQHKHPPNHLKRVGLLDHQVGRVAVVDRILEHSKDPATNEDKYLVQWKDLPEIYNQWVAYSDFQDSTPILK
jgi:hypothetical protein